jgi:hypothetical protein
VISLLLALLQLSLLLPALLLLLLLTPQRMPLRLLLQQPSAPLTTLLAVAGGASALACRQEWAQGCVWVFTRAWCVCVL